MVVINEVYATHKISLDRCETWLDGARKQQQLLLHTTINKRLDERKKNNMWTLLIVQPFRNNDTDININNGKTCDLRPAIHFVIVCRPESFERNMLKEQQFQIVN